MVTLFAGSHSIHSLTSEQNDISCTDCHKQIQNELNISPIHSDLTCESCHRFRNGITFAEHNSTGIYAGKEAHASYTPACLDCHGDDGVYVVNKTGSNVYAPPAPEFNESYGSDNSSHKRFIEVSNNYGMSVGENEACIACHTNYSMKFRFIKPEYIQYDIVDSNSGINAKDWEIQNFVRASDNTTAISVSRTGAKHQWISGSDVNCFGCHSDVENGGHIPSSLEASGPGNKVNGHAGRFHNFSRSDVDIAVCTPCHLSNSSNFAWDHSGHAQLDYHAATTEHCKQCHKYGAEKAVSSGFCICPCHSALASNGNDRCYGNSFPSDHKNLLGNMESLSYWGDSLTDKVCVACHLPSGYDPPFPLPFPNDNGQFRFRIYTEPDFRVESPKVKDNLEASYVGTCPTSTSEAGYYGTNFQYHDKGTGSNTCTWTFTINISGNYDVWTRWTAWNSDIFPNRATNAPYTVYYYGSSETVLKNQQTGAYRWQKLGTCYYEARIRLF